MTETASPGAVTFPCANCGAKLDFDPRTQGLACPFCGHRQAVVAPAGGGAAVADVALEEGLRLAARGLGAPVTTIQCRDCGATVNVGQGERTAACAFCGSRSVLALQTNAEAIRPSAMVPFHVSKEDANRRFGAWLGALWFRPSDLKRI